jgi:eukaryotic-like serine/threonine-protein kinase
MFCNHCGAANPDGSRICSACGRTTTVTSLGGVPAAQETELGLPQGSIIANRYRILGTLGIGGMGRVYLAEDQRLGVKVAIKVLREALARDPGSLKRLIVEAKCSIQLAHPNIVRVNHFEDCDMVKFLVMEFVEGQTLAHLIADKGKLAEDEVRRIATAICQGLEYAHAKKVIHRDIKPGNILLGNDGSIKLADFGIARECRDSMSRITSQSDSGTLTYMSPEQLDGESGERSDIYSMGVVLYEMLSGDVPFRTGDVIGQIRNKEPKPLADVSPKMSAAVMRCLEKKPQNRIASAKDLGEVLGGTADKLRDAARQRKEEEERTVQAREAEAAEKAARQQQETQLARIYSRALENLEVGYWKDAIEGFQSVLKLDAAYRDAPARLAKALEAEEAEAKSREQAEAERAAKLAKEKAAAERKARDKEAAERKARDKEAAERKAKERAAEQRKEKQQAEPERKVREKIEAERQARETVISATNADKVSLLRELRGHAGKVIAIAFGPDGKLIATGAADKTVLIWRAADGDLSFTLSRKSSSYAYGNALAISPDAATLAIGSAEGGLALWSMPIVEGTHSRALEGHSKGVMCLAFSPDGKLLASGSDDCTVRMYQVSDGRLVFSRGFGVFSSFQVMAVAFSMDGSVLVGVTQFGDVRSWLVRDGSLVGKLKGQLNAQGLLDRGAFNAHGRLFNPAGAGQKVWPWLVSNDLVKYILKNHAGTVPARGLTLSPDGTLLASGSHDQTIKLWRLSDRALLNTLQGHAKQVNCVAFSPDGTLLVSGGGSDFGREGDIVRLWRVR